MKKFFFITLLSLTISVFGKSQVPVPPVSGDNPYDYIGNSHNAILQSFFSEYTPERARQEHLTYNDLKSYVISKSGAKETEVVEKMLAQPVFQSVMGTTFTELPARLEQMNVISVRCGNYLRSLDATIETSLGAGITSFNTSAIQFEKNVLQDKELSEVEKGILLGTASTARFSAAFWNEFAENMDSKAKGSNSSTKIPGWLKAILKADASGAASGGIAGAIIGGAITVGAMTYPGWVVGAITGGAGSSVGNAIEQLWELIF